jgi:hypothetical protein
MTTLARTGLVLFALLSIGDVADLFLTDGNHPPYSVAITGAVLGIASLGLLPSAWRGSRTAIRLLCALRVVSALTAVPAFFVAGVDVAPVVLAAAIVVLTGLAVVLVAGSTRRTAAVAR